MADVRPRLTQKFLEGQIQVFPDNAAPRAPLVVRHLIFAVISLFIQLFPFAFYISSLVVRRSSWLSVFRVFHMN